MGASGRRYDRIIDAIRADQHEQRCIGITDAGLCEGEFEAELFQDSGIKMHCLVGAMQWHIGVQPGEHNQDHPKLLEHYGLKLGDTAALIDLNDSFGGQKAERVEHVLRHLYNPDSMDHKIAAFHGEPGADYTEDEEDNGLWYRPGL